MTKAGEWAVLRRRAQGIEGTTEQQEAARLRIGKKAAYAKAYRTGRTGTNGQIVIAKAIREAALTLIAGRPRPSACEVCNEANQYVGPVHFDHCHATGAFRGWLCVRCNHTLGKVGDNPQLLRKLAAYLESPPGPSK